MGTGAATDHRVEINSTVMSGWITNVELPREFEALDDTAFGDTAKSRVKGLEDSTIKIDFNQDFGAGGPDATIAAILGTVVVIKVRPTTAAIGATNPEYVGSYLVSQYSPFVAKVGDLETFSVSWPLSDPDGIARNVA